MFNYVLSEKYKHLMSKIMGPNPIKLCEELLFNNKIKEGSIVCDLGSGQGVTSIFMAKEYKYKVYASDLWSDPLENRIFFKSNGIYNNEIIPVKADATNLPFEKDFFDAVVCTDSYNYFGRDSEYLDKRLLPFVKKGGYIYLAITGMKKDYHNELPSELLLSWDKEQLEYIQDITYWQNIFNQSNNTEIIELSEMYSNEEVWSDWIKQDNEYAIGDRKSIEAGALKYLNFIKVVLKKK